MKFSVNSISNHCSVRCCFRLRVRSRHDGTRGSGNPPGRIADGNARPARQRACRRWRATRLARGDVAVVPGTRFLVRLESDLNTKEVHKNQVFRVRTLEPLEAGQGNYLPPGAVIRRTLSRVDPAWDDGPRENLADL